MKNPAGIKSSRGSGVREQRIPFDQEKFERARFDLGTGVIGRVNETRFAAFAAPPGIILDRSIRLNSRGHGRVLVRQMKQRPRRSNRDRLIAILRLTPHSRPARVIVNVGADVQLQKLSQARNARESSWPDLLHKERHDAEPGRTFEGIDREPRRERPLHHRDGKTPMQKKQMRPGLSHHTDLRGPLTHRESLIR